tara:strand:- start:178 stop:444 length:267 start_codon:yes stop_codon:yes gene_type:complete
MNIFRSVDETNNFLISGVDYDFLSLINSSLIKKLEEVKSRMIRTKKMKNETTNKEMILQLKEEVDYCKYVKHNLEQSLQKIHLALTDI